MLLEPGHVLVVRSGLAADVLDQRRHSAAISPLVDFGMAVGEGKPASAAMVAGGPINHLMRRRVGIAIHLDHEIAVVDAVFALIKQYEGVGRPWVAHFRDPAIHLPAAAVAPVPAVAGRVIAIAADPVAHGHAPEPRHALFEIVDRSARVGRAVVDAEGLAIGPD